LRGGHRRGMRIGETGHTGGQHDAGFAKPGLQRCRGDQNHGQGGGERQRGAEAEGAAGLAVALTLGLERPQGEQAAVEPCRPASASGIASATSTLMLTAASSRASCTTVATVDSTAPAAAGLSRLGVSFTRLAIAPMVAELETNPEANPDTGRPKRTPIRRTA